MGENITSSSRHLLRDNFLLQVKWNVYVPQRSCKIFLLKQATFDFLGTTGSLNLQTQKNFLEKDDSWQLQ